MTEKTNAVSTARRVVQQSIDGEQVTVLDPGEGGGGERKTYIFIPERNNRNIKVHHLTLHSSSAKPSCHVI